MNSNFNYWLNRRQNNVNEGLFDWLWGKKKTTPTPEQLQKSQAPIDPSEIDKTIYSNPLINKYFVVVLDHMGIKDGMTLQRIDPRSGDVADEFQVANFASQFPEFRKALQRFIAGHVIGGGEEHSYLRISQHDAMTIIDTLDRLRRPESRNSLADELHIENPNALIDWMQTRLPTAANAKLQQGYGQAHTDYISSRIARGRGNPLSHPTVKALVDASREAVDQGLEKRIPRGLYNALVQVQIELSKLGVKTSPVKPVARPRRGVGEGAPGKAGPV